MSVKIKFNGGKEVELNAKELHDLQNALAFAAQPNNAISSKQFGSIQVTSKGSHQAFTHGEQTQTRVQTDC